MKSNILTKQNVVSGIMAGLIAGLVFGFILARMGVLSYAGRFLAMSDPLSAFITHMVFSGILGVIFALIFFHGCTSFFNTTLWGIVYGIIWWFIGPMVLCPWMNGLPISWESGQACNAIPMLFGHLVFGITLGVSYFWMRNRKK